jgi:LuxR family maltose regulon positive regulatory protein
LDELEKERRMKLPSHDLQALIPQTRLHAPQTGADILKRPLLLTRLQQAIADYPFTLISAPAGSGKTTLVAAWLHDQPSLSVTWLRLAEEENELAGFFMALLAALRQLDPHFGADWQDLVTTTPDLPGSAQRLSGVLVNEILASSIRPFALVLDDLHVIQDPVVLNALSSLLENLPPDMHLIATSRYDPPLALARMRLQGRLAEIHLDELRFDESDTRTLLNDNLQLNLAAGELALLQTHTEGWIAGLRLLALSLNRRRSTLSRSAFLRNLTQSGRNLFSFLAEEVFNDQPPDIQRFLITTAVLDELTPDMCTAVTQQQDSPQQLDDLLRRNLFLNLVEGSDGTLVYRYHDLFADLLRQQLTRTFSREQIQELHRRAAEAAVRPDQAIHHYLVANLWPEATDVIVQVGKSQLTQGFVQAQVAKWIAQLPPASVAKHPYLQLLLGVVAYRSGHMAEARTHLEQADRLVQTADDDGGATWTRFYLAAALLELEGPQALLTTLSSIPLDPLPIHMQVLAHILLVWAYFPLYDWAKIDEHFSQAMNLTLSSGDDRAYRLLAQHMSASLYFGDLGVSPFRQFCRQALARFGEGDGIIQMGVYLQLASIAAFEGRLDEVMHQAQQVVTISQRFGGFGYVDQNIGFAQGLVLAAYDNYEGAELVLDNALRQADERGQFRAMLLGLSYFMGRAAWLAGNARRIQDMQALLASVDNRLQSLEAEAVEALLAAYLADLDGRYATAEQSARRAIQLQNRFRHPMATGSSRLVLAELYLKWKRPSDALTTAQPALADWARRQMPGGLLLHGSNLIPLLELASKHGVQADFAQEVLALFPNRAKARAITVPETGEKLTPRETEVLYLLLDGASNRAIADQLVISERTVKSHVSKILAKLNASSRTEAAAKARAFLA